MVLPYRINTDLEVKFKKNASLIDLGSRETGATNWPIKPKSRVTRPETSHVG
jgi:hypothetical protein